MIILQFRGCIRNFTVFQKYIFFKIFWIFYLRFYIDFILYNFFFVFLRTIRRNSTIDRYIYWSIYLMIDLSNGLSIESLIHLMIDLYNDHSISWLIYLIIDLSYDRSILRSINDWSIYSILSIHLMIDLSNDQSIEWLIYLMTDPSKDRSNLSNYWSI